MAAASNSEFKLVGPTNEEPHFLKQDVPLSCHLSPKISAVNLEIRWFKETECVCLYKNRKVTEGKGYEGRVKLFTDELERGNVSLQLKNTSFNDKGDYLCQVTDGDTTEEFTIKIRDPRDSFKANVPMFGIPPVFVSMSDRQWTGDERIKMYNSALLTEYKSVEGIIEEFKKKNGQLEMTEEQLKNAKLELKSNKQHLKDFSKELDESKNMLEQITAKLEESQNEIEKNIQVLSDKDSEISDLKNTLEKKTKEIMENQKRLKETLKGLEESQNMLAKTKTEIEETQNELKDKCMQQERTKNELETIKNTLKDKNNRLEEKNQQLSTKEAEFIKNEKELQEKVQILSDKDSQIAEVNNTLEISANQLMENQRELEKTVKELEESKNTVETLNNDLKNKNSEVHNKTLLLKQLKSEMTEKNKQLKKKESHLSEKETQLMEKDKEIQEKDRLLEERRKLQEASDPVSGESQDSAAPVRRRNSMQGSPSMNNESQDAAAPIRRKNSMDYPPYMSGASCQDPSMLTPVSELRMVLLGKTGSGKSLAGNMVLGKEGWSQTITTERSEMSQGEVAGRKVTVVDTPDWFCPGVSLEELRQDVRHCLQLSAPGPHAFLLVIPVKQPTGDQSGMLEKMEEIFGDRCWRNTMILFTVTDEVQKNIQEFVQSGNQELQTLIEKFENRFHCLNIKESGDGSQVSELLEKIEKMERFYSSEIYLETESQIQALRNTVLKEINKVKEEIESKEKLQKDMLQTIEGEISKHEGDITELNDRTTELERKMKEEADEEKKRELQRELQREVDKRKKMEANLNRLREKEKEEMEKKHQQEMEMFREECKIEALEETQKKLMKIIMPEVQKNISELNRQIAEKNTEIEQFKQKLSEQTLTMERSAAANGGSRGMFQFVIDWIFVWRTA